MKNVSKNKDNGTRSPLCIWQFPQMSAYDWVGSSPTRRAAMREIQLPSWAAYPWGLKCSKAICWFCSVVPSLVPEWLDSLSEWWDEVDPATLRLVFGCFRFLSPWECLISMSLLLPVAGSSCDSSPTCTFKPESAPNLDARIVAAAALAAGSGSNLWYKIPQVKSKFQLQASRNNHFISLSRS